MDNGKIVQYFSINETVTVCHGLKNESPRWKNATHQSMNAKSLKANQIKEIEKDN